MLGAGIRRETAAVEPHQHGRAPGRDLGRRPNVEEEAILGHAGRGGVSLRGLSELHRIEPELRPVAHAAARPAAARADASAADPTGGAAYGMPRKTRTSVPVPEISPDAVRTLDGAVSIAPPLRP